MTVRDSAETLEEVNEILDSLIESEHTTEKDGHDIGMAMEHLDNVQRRLKMEIGSETNTTKSLPTGERMSADEHLDLPELPGVWEWTHVSRNSMNKVNLYFESGNLYQPGNWMGEIDNYVNSHGDEQWGLHIRVIEPKQNGDGTRPASEPATTAEFDTLADAIDAVPSHVATHYEVGGE